MRAYSFNFSYQVLNADVPHGVVQHEVDFHVIPRLKARMAGWEEESLGDDLFSLSPLTSPETSPAATPTMKVAELPAENSDACQAAEPLPRQLMND